MPLSRRAKKQLSVILILLIPLLAVAWLFFLPRFFIREPTCFDGKQNQGELGIDCGGPCVSCELGNPKPISVFWARALPLGENTFDVAARIKNENGSLAAPAFEYEFVLFDKFGEVARREGTAFLLPRETLHIVEINLKAKREPEKVEFKVKKVSWKPGEKFLPGLNVERKDYKVEEFGAAGRSAVEAVLFNRSLFGFKEVEVLFMILDPDGNLLAANKVTVENFLSDSRREVRSVWPREISGKIGQIIVEPRVNILDQATILKP